MKELNNDFHDNATNMGVVRACGYIFVVLVSCQLVAGKPFFGSLLMLCALCDDDYDDATSTTASYEDLFDYLCDCGPRPRRTTTPRPGQLPNNFRMAIPPANGVNLTMSNVNGLWEMVMSPWRGAPGAPATPAPAMPMFPAPAAPAPAAPAAPAPAGATAATIAPTAAPIPAAAG